VHGEVAVLIREPTSVTTSIRRGLFCGTHHRPSNAYVCVAVQVSVEYSARDQF
jgi:hypothetical protein